MSRQKKSSRSRPRRRVEISLRVILFQTIISRKRQEIDEQLNSEIDDYELFDNEEIEKLNSDLENLELLFESLEKPSGIISSLDISTPFDDECNELQAQFGDFNDSTGQKRGRQGNCDDDDMTGDCWKQPNKKFRC